MSFAAGSSTTTQTSPRPAFHVTSPPFIPFPTEIRTGSSLGREFTLLRPFTIEWYQMFIEKLASAVYEYRYLEDNLSQNIVEWASRVFKLGLDSIAASEDSRSKSIELINELSNTILINPLTLESGKTAEALVTPMTDGDWWWEEGRKDQLWTLEHYKAICLVDPPLSAYDIRKELRAIPHPLAKKIIAIRNAVMLSVPPATFSSAAIASSTETPESKEEKKYPPSISTPTAEVTQSERIVYSVQYMQKATTAMRCQEERGKTQRLFTSHQITVMRLEMQQMWQEKVEQLEKKLTDIQEQLEKQIESMNEGNEAIVSGLKERLDKMQKELSTANTKLAEVSSLNTVHALVIGTMGETLKNQLQEMEALKNKVNTPGPWGGAKIDHSGGFCVIL